MSDSPLPGQRCQITKEETEHIRKKLENKIQNTELLVQLCNYSTSLNKILNKYDIAQEDKDFLNQEARLVWQHLK